MTYLLSMLLVSMGKIGTIINKKFGDAVTVTIGSRIRDSANPDSDELFEAAGAPGVYFYAHGTRRIVSDGILLVM
jgi:hypothetical protein